MKTKMIATLVGFVACVLVGSVFADVYLYDTSADPLTGTGRVVADTTSNVVGGVTSGVVGVTGAVLEPVGDVVL